MIVDDFPRAFLSRYAHRYFMIKPWGCNHTFTGLIKLSGCAGNHKAYAVNEPHGCLNPGRKLHRNCLLRHKFRFCSHDGSSGTALGQLVSGTVAQVFVLNMREYQRLHKLLNKGGFPCAHRTYHSDVNISACTQRNVFIY